MRKRLLFLGLGGALLAQQPAAAPAVSLAELRAAAEKRASEWDTINKGLEARLARMLPCDARVKSGLAEAAGASEARFEAYTKYVQAALAKAKEDLAALRKLIASHQARSADFASERTETEQELAAIRAQSGELLDVMKKRPEMAAAHKILQDVAAANRERSNAASQRAHRATTMAEALTMGVSAFSAREGALESELAALQNDAARWRAYYVARTARADVECSLTGGAAPAPAPKKQP